MSNPISSSTLNSLPASAVINAHSTVNLVSSLSMHSSPSSLSIDINSTQVFESNIDVLTLVKPHIKNKSSKSSSPWWDYVMLPDPNIHSNLKEYAKCNDCDFLIKIELNDARPPGGIKRHFMYKHNEKYADVLGIGSMNGKKSPSNTIITIFF